LGALNASSSLMRAHVRRDEVAVVAVDHRQARADVPEGLSIPHWSCNSLQL
jgi:hypothetical protein